MMISVENYYESELKCKSTDEIMTAIRSLKKKIAKLKRIVEDPLYSCESDPSESVQLHWSKNISKEQYRLFQKTAELIRLQKLRCMLRTLMTI